MVSLAAIRVESELADFYHDEKSSYVSKLAVIQQP